LICVLLNFLWMCRVVYTLNRKYKGMDSSISGYTCVVVS
jgi:hypothetical protein